MEKKERNDTWQACREGDGLSVRAIDRTVGKHIVRRRLNLGYEEGI